MITMIARYFRASCTCTMVGMVIKGADSAIYGEDTCTPVFMYIYCTLAHVTLVEYSTWNQAADKAAVSSLRSPVLLSRKSNAILLEAVHERS